MIQAVQLKWLQQHCGELWWQEECVCVCVFAPNSHKYVFEFIPPATNMFVFFLGCFKVTVGFYAVVAMTEQKLSSTDLQLRGRKYVEMWDSDTKNKPAACMFGEDVAETGKNLHRCAAQRLSCGRGEGSPGKSTYCKMFFCWAFGLFRHLNSLICSCLFKLISFLSHPVKVSDLQYNGDYTVNGPAGRYTRSPRDKSFINCYYILFV